MDWKSSYDYRDLGLGNVRRKIARDRRGRLPRQTSISRRHERRPAFAGSAARLGGQSLLLSAKYSNQRHRDSFQLPRARTAPRLDSSHSRSRRALPRAVESAVLSGERADPDALRTAHTTASAPENEGGIEAWLRLGEACGLPRAELIEDRHLQHGVRFAVDAYANFARTRPWPVAIASSLTELFAPDLMKRRLAGFEKSYSWIDPRGLDYFRRRVTQAQRDSNEALAITLEYCNTPELQREAVRALEFKCDVLWSILDAIHYAYRNC